MSEVDARLVGIPAARVDAVEAYWAAAVGAPEWDVFAGIHGLGPLDPPKEPSERLAGIVDMSSRAWDLRGMRERAERQDLDPKSFNWPSMPGLAEIQDPASDVARSIMWLCDVKGMIRSTSLSPEVQSGVPLGLGAANLTPLHRVQKMFGHHLSVPDADGKLPVSVPDATAHPLLTANEGLFVTIGSGRKLDDRKGEPEKVAGYAPGATDEFGLVVAASRFVHRGQRLKEYREQLPDAGYKTVGDEPARVVIHELDGGNKVVKHLYAPNPVETKAGRAQTLHSYALLGSVLSREVDGQGGALMGDDSNIIIPTNATFGPFQETAAVSQLRLPYGWLPRVFTFSAEEAGLVRKPVDLLTELQSHVRQLERLQARIETARQHQA